MKTIFRSLNTGLFLASIIALGAVAGFAEDPCADGEGQAAANDKIQVLFKDKTIAGRKAYVEAGKTFLEKYGACESAKELADYLKPQIPKIEEVIRKMEADKAEGDLVARFDTALKSKTWDDVYSVGKELLQKNPEKYRTVEIVLGAVGGEEALKANFKYNDDAVRFAKQSIADLESGKAFVLGGKPKFGLSLKDSYNFEFANKDDAIGWMNLYIGYINQFGLKNKVAAAPYFYKASTANSESNKNPIVYTSIGSFYVDDVKKLAAEVDALVKTQLDTDTPEVAKQKLDAIKAKVAMVNGTSEAAIDAYARAYNIAKADPKSPKPYVDGINKTLQELYNVRFGKMDGFDAFVMNLVKKPFPNPQTPVAPIRDPEPVAATAPAVTPGTTTMTTPPVKPGTTTVKPPVTTPAKPPASTTVKKPQATVKKPVAKKKVG